ncbi:hypothetical protein [Wolbachia endosymbiont of Folsomia candida]|uniref:hypothetical protein n=1 Tax=Wolbachia endosymbiont of Folsomia candida TaxID=169402 RepID=UPI000B003FCB|nr:hypothetical protein [Wolbachia endosymbiont of Folsomia candida]APR98392.1 hypothetical protein ASM33_03835 [Wolbachia endosymbiont of Folsomia candida]
MQVTHKTIIQSKEVNKNTKYIIYFPGNAEDVGQHSFQDWSWCDKNTVIDLCNYPYHSEWHNPNILGRSKSKSIAYHIITLLPFIAAIAALYFLTPLAAAIPVSILLGVTFLVTTLLVNNVMIRSNAKFYTRGEDSVAVGVKRVLDLLEKGVDPDNIILKGQSIGGGVAAEVYKKFESKGIYLRCQISTSFSSIADVFMPVGNNGNKEDQRLIKRILKIGHWDIETYKTINSITPYTMFFNNEDDQVIKKNAQLATKIREMEKNGEKKSSQATEDKIFEILFKKHTILKPNSTGRRLMEEVNNNTHNFPLHLLESAESSYISARELHYLFTYLPYHMDVLHTEVNSFIENGSYGDYGTDNDKQRIVEVLWDIFNILDREELNELKGLLDNLDKKASCLTKNQNYRETSKNGTEKLKEWVERYNISFVDLDKPKTPGGFLIMHTSSSCARLLNNEEIFVN